MSKDELINLLLAELKATKTQLVKCSRLLSDACGMLVDKSNEKTQREWEKWG